MQPLLLLELSSSRVISPLFSETTGDRLMVNVCGATISRVLQAWRVSVWSFSGENFEHSRDTNVPNVQRYGYNYISHQIFSGPILSCFVLGLYVSVSSR